MRTAPLNTDANPPRPRRRIYRIPRAGWTYILVVALLGIGSVNSQNNLLFFIFGLALGAILASGVISGSMMMGIRITRSAPQSARVNEPAHIRYTVYNLNTIIPLFAIRIEEATLIPDKANKHLKPNEPQPPFFGLFASKLPTPIPRPHAFLQHLAARSHTDISATLRPARRGPITLNTIRVSTTFPLGIVEKTIIFDVPHTITTEPPVQHINTRELRHTIEKASHHDTPANARGLGLEFYGLREYSPGDSPRFISWTASARTGRLVTRETESDANPAVTISLELPQTSPALDPDTLAQHDPLTPIDSPEEHAITHAASLAAAAVRDHRRVGLTCNAAGINIPPSSSASSLRAILHALATLDVNNATTHHQHRQPLTPTLAITPANIPEPAANA